MIKFCKNYEAKRDGYEWMLYVYNDAGECQQFLYPTLRKVCKEVYDMTNGQCDWSDGHDWVDDMDEILTALKSMSSKAGQINDD